jgi:ATP-dependent phosphofructokinase / diphosphate-dependent phosphofructokinase
MRRVSRATRDELAARRYLAPLVVGEVHPPFRNGLPEYVKLQNHVTRKKLSKEFSI